MAESKYYYEFRMRDRDAVDRNVIKLRILRVGQETGRSMGVLGVFRCMVAYINMSVHRVA